MKDQPTMRLAEFILANIPKISAEWEKFAGTLLPERSFSRLVLRDGIESLLKEIAYDMRQAQTAEQQHKKAEGDGGPSLGLDDVAQGHAFDRVEMGVSSQQLISEFRALRASVIQLWQQTIQAVDITDLHDVTRFNEAIDQSLTKAEEGYTKLVVNSRQLFLGVLGHDLRNPLAAITSSAEALLRAQTLDRNTVLASKILMSTGRMTHMVTDLIDLTRVQLGKGIPVSLTEADLHDICRRVIDEMEVIHPAQTFKLSAGGSLFCRCDIPKMIQVLSNIVGNAVQHGTPGAAITVTTLGNSDGVRVQVHNEGPGIPTALLPEIFDCFVQANSGLKSDDDQSSSLGLGLYIAKEIVVAHGGTIDVQSSEGEGTTFTIGLPL